MANLKQTLTSAIEYLDKQGIGLPLSLHADLYRAGIKNAAGLARSVRSAVRELYNSLETQSFINQMFGLIEAQFTAAWFEGMAENGLYKKDFTEEMGMYLSAIIVKEQGFVTGYAKDIETASENGSPVDPLLSRADLWGNRYNEVVNEAKLFTAEMGDKMVWIYGDTDHCTTCEALDGIVALASEWYVAGVKPQSAPNQFLECGGWRCQCRLEPTTERRTPNSFGKILNAMNNR